MSYRRKPNYILWLAVAGAAYFFRKNLEEIWKKISKKA